MIIFDPCYITLKTLNPGATFVVALDTTDKIYLLLNPMTIKDGDTCECCFAVNLSTGEVSEMDSSLFVIPLNIRAGIRLS